MQHKLGLAGLLCLSLSACGDAPQEPLNSRVNGLALPTGPHETITVSGKMTFWMYEGDAGCYGSLLTAVRRSSCGLMPTPAATPSTRERASQRRHHLARRQPVGARQHLYDHALQLSIKRPCAVS
ncbi:hypothetical protein UMZ34_11075 [Halopseudomonas pachastrellae]|nr:hypothetical protein UMZ34_11075 [Halopseudomonas pachastrellae]